MNTDITSVSSHLIYISLVDLVGLPLYYEICTEVSNHPNHIPLDVHIGVGTPLIL